MKRHVVTALSISLMFALVLPARTFGASEKDVEKLGGECSAGKDKSCRELIKIAERDKAHSVRMAAVRRLADQALLAGLARGAASEDVRKAAVEKLTDAAVLADVARNEENPAVRTVAVNNPRLVDRNLFVELARNDSALSVRSAAVERYGPRALIHDIAPLRLEVKNDLPAPARAAFDADVELPMIFRNILADRDANAKGTLRVSCKGSTLSADYSPLGIGPGLGREAGPIVSRETGAIVEFELCLVLPQHAVWCRRLTGRKSPPERIIDSPEASDGSLQEHLFGEAFDRLFPELTTFLVDVASANAVIPLAKKPTNWRVQKAAVEFLTDAVRRLTGQDLLDEIARTDQSVLAAIAKNDASMDVGSAVAERATVLLTDQADLAQIAESHGRHTVRIVAVKKLVDRTVLQRVADFDTVHAVREAARERLKELKTAVGRTGATAPASVTPKMTAGDAVALTEACGAGDIQACFDLSWLHEEGRVTGWLHGPGAGEAYKKGVAIDSAKAAALAGERCTNGFGKSCVDLASMYSRGDGVPTDKAKAAELYQKACDGGNAFGCAWLGMAYVNGEGVEKDEPRGFALTRTTCENSSAIGSAIGCANLAFLYSTGLGTPKDDAKSAEAAKRACDGYSAGGCYNLGVDYSQGQGVPYDPVRAAEFLVKACDGGLQPACSLVPRAKARAQRVR